MTICIHNLFTGLFLEGGGGCPPQHSSLEICLIKRCIFKFQIAKNQKDVKATSIFQSYLPSDSFIYFALDFKGNT